jgi:hypothetical protein
MKAIYWAAEFGHTQVFEFLQSIQKK